MKITLNQMFCENPTWQYGSDEIYVAVQAIPLRSSDGKHLKPTFCLTSVQTQVQKGNRYTPVFQMDGSNQLEINIGDGDTGADQVLLSLVVYEKDDAKLYKEMLEKQFILQGDTLNWIDVANGVAEFAAAVFAKNTKECFRLLYKAFTKIVKDDQIQENHFIVNPKDENSMGERQLRFAGLLAKYNLSIRIDNNSSI